MKGTKLKGTVYERKIVNDYVDQDPTNRLGGRFSGSANKGKHKFDVILIDWNKKEIHLQQAKDAKDWPQSRKILHTERLKRIFDGDYKVFASFV